MSNLLIKLCRAVMAFIILAALVATILILFPFFLIGGILVFFYQVFVPIKRKEVVYE